MTLLVLSALVLCTSSCQEDLFLLRSSDANSVPPPPPTGELESIDLGAGTSCAVVSDRQVFCWGNNANSVMVTNASSPLTMASSILLPERVWVELGTGGESEFACARSRDGELYCWGQNESGELATGDFAPVADPVQIPLPAPVERFAAGFDTVCAVLTTGELWCWGNRFEGQLGDGTRRLDPLPRPQKVGTESDWQQVTAGDGHVCGLRADGQLWCWGRNSGMELGLGLGTRVQYQTPQRVGGQTGWSDVSAAANHTCALRGGELYCWGLDFHDQIRPSDGLTILDTPTRIGDRTDWQSVRTQAFNTCGLTADGTAFCWGRNVEGQLGIGFASNSEPPTPIPGGPWDEVSLGRFHMCARKGANVFCAGANSGGELGVGDLNRRSSPNDPVIFP